MKLNFSTLYQGADEYVCKRMQEFSTDVPAQLELISNENLHTMEL